MKMYKILLLLCSMLYTTNSVALTKQQLASDNALCWGFYSKAHMLRVENSKPYASKYFTNVQLLGYNPYQSFIIKAFKQGELMFVNTRSKDVLLKVKFICANADSYVVSIYNI